MNKRSRTISASIMALQPIIVNAIGIPVAAYIIRTLGPRDYGSWAVAVSWIGFTGIITNFGLRPAFVRYIAHNPDDAPRALGIQLSLRCVMAVGASVIAFGICAMLD